MMDGIGVRDIPNEPVATDTGGRAAGWHGDVGRQRPRRLRASRGLRELVAEVDLLPRHLLQPMFAVPGRGVKKPIGSLQGQFQLSPDRFPAEVEPLAEAGIGGIVLFGQPEVDRKDAIGTPAWDPEGPVPRAIRAIKARFPELLVITDVCLDPYTSHGHCGVVEGDRILNDESLPYLAQMAVMHAEAGADVTAPSDMMDGRVGALRDALDAAGFSGTAILSYAVKYASSLYAPFREAENSAPAFGDRRSYQMDPRNVREALKEAALDVSEGADMLMVKPAGLYLDVIRAVQERTDRPVLAYQVSGEYAMLRAAGDAGLLDFDAVLLESLYGIRRAGAAAILTYGAAQAAALLRL